DPGGARGAAEQRRHHRGRRGGGRGGVSRAIVARVDFGTARLEPDPACPTGWSVLVDGVTQSYVDLADPTRQPVPYLRRLAAVVDAAGPRAAPLRALHLGGGGLSLPRYLAATRPGSTQQVVDRDAALLELVTRLLPLPADADVRLVVGEAGATLATLPAQGYDLVVGDVYEGARMPRSVAGVDFAAGVARLLGPGGLYAVNVTDLPPLAFGRTQVATLRAVFGQVCVLAEPGMLRGRRYGNLVLVASGSPGGVPVDRLASRLAARDPGGARVLHGAEVPRFAAGARPLAAG
ncbi:MAG TPA: fused MFS/spermidine synthase, partial [Catenuloplanes sp.]